MPQSNNANYHKIHPRSRWIILILPAALSILLLLFSFSLMNAATFSEGTRNLALESPKTFQDSGQNESGSTQMEKSFDSDTARHTRGVAWTDYDGDGDLDLAVGNGQYQNNPGYNMVNQLYVNLGGGSFREDSIGEVAFNTRAVAWGDWDGDGDSDLAVANDGRPNQVYENVQGQLRLNPEENWGWTAPISDSSTSLAWGDWDGDGDLDLAVGNDGAANRVYSNISDTLQLSWESPGTGPLQTTGVAWADWDNDGDLDLSVANYDGPDQIYENISNTLQIDPDNQIGWQSEPLALADSLEVNCVANRPWQGREDQNFEIRTRTLAWGDWNGDGFLDLATGGGPDNNDCGAFLRVYTNVSGTLQLDDQIGWQMAVRKSKFKPASIAFADWDGDGDLDLGIGNNAGSGWGNKNQIYENTGDEFKLDLPRFGWESDINPGLFAENSYAIAFGDADGDGDLDMAVGNGGRFNGGQTNVIVANTTPVVALTPQPWLSPDAQASSSTAWGDWDGDGDLDLAVGNVGRPNQIYENENGQLNFDPGQGIGWQSTVITNDLTTSIAWGDWDNDGDLDLAVGNNNQSDYVYLNDGGTLTLTLDGRLGWVSEQISSTQSIAWGDWDRDGDLDLAAGHCDTGQEDQPALALVYENRGNGTLRVDPAQDLGWMSPDPICAKSVGWGDWDGDADLDLALGARVFENDANQLILNSRRGYGWDGQIDAESVAWGDMDGDGDLDLAVGLWDRNRVYENAGGTLLFAPNGTPSWGWASRDTLRTMSVAWGDVDGDEDLDLAVANTAFWGHAPNQIYENKNNTLSDRGVWRSADDRLNPDGLLIRSQDIAWGDIDNDGDLDLAVANQCLYNQCPGPELPNQVYINTLQGNTTVADGTPLISIDEPYSTASADFYASPEILSTSSISLPYTLRDPNEVPVGQIKVYFSLDGGDQWKEAVPLAGTRTTNLATSAVGTNHIFSWDTFASNFFGQSDNVVIRMVAYPSPPIGTEIVSGTYRYFNQTSGSSKRPSVSDTSFPFRVQSTQIKVITGDGSPLPGAYVYRLPDGRVSGAELMPSHERRLRTDEKGFLPGEGELTAGDKLIALYPVDMTAEIPFTDKFSFFYTSGSPTEGGLEMFQFEDPEIIELQISDDNPLLLFHLDMALEWDVSNEPEFQVDLVDGIERASELLFDVSDGQVALGDVRIFYDKEYWPSADVLVLADNSLRPLAPIGGVVQVPLSETVRTGLTGTKVISNAYVNSQIKMGTVWDPFGESNTDLGPDWWQALAHELAHYLLFLPDDYLGFKDENSLGKINCHGSFMTSTYDPEFSEFLTADEWEADDECLISLAERTTGRPDWETILTFYPMLNEPNPKLHGPRNLPIKVTKVFFIDPQETRSTLRARNFEVRDDNFPNPERLRLPAAQAYLFQTQGTDDLSDDVLIKLGTPTGGGDRLKVRGAFPRDRLCLFDRSGSQDYAGCIGSLDSADVAINIAQIDNNWQPKIEVNPVTSRTMEITVSQAISEGTNIHVQMFPNHYWSAPGYSGLSPSAVMSTTAITNNHTQTLNLLLPAYDVTVRVWVEGDPGRESIEQFRLNPPWESSNAGPNSGLTGGPNSGLTGGPNSGLTGGPNSGLTGGPNSGLTGGPNSGLTGGPNSGLTGGPNSGLTGGPNSGLTGGPNSGLTGGPNSGLTGGPNSGLTGGAQTQTFNAPILSADAHVVVYSKRGLFEDNGVEILQLLDSIPGLDTHPWLLPVGQAYRVELNPKNKDDRIMTSTYLQRDVPEGYEHTLNFYFLAEGGKEWIRLDTNRYVENLVVTELKEGNGTYAIMATIEMPALKPGWNLFSYPMPDSRPVTETLASIAGSYDTVYFGESGEKPPVGAETNVTQFEFGKAYWIWINEDEAMTPYLAPPIRTPEGIIPGS